MFKDRHDAGVRLAWALARYKDHDAVVLAVPRGGVPVAGALAHELGLKLDALFLERLTHPDDPERSIGTVSLRGVDLDPDAAKGVPSDYVAAAAEAAREDLRARYWRYRGAARPQPLRGRTVLVVDDVAFTGRTLCAAVARARAEGAGRVVVAVPVGTEEALENLVVRADEAKWLSLARGRAEIEDAYRLLGRVSDAEAEEVFRREGAAVN